MSQTDDRNPADDPSARLDFEAPSGWADQAWPQEQWVEGRQWTEPGQAYARQTAWTPADQTGWTPPAPKRRRGRGVLIGTAAMVVAGALGLNSLGLLDVAGVGGTTTPIMTPAASAPVVPAAPAPAATAPQSQTQTQQPVNGPGGTSTATTALSKGVVLIESTMAGGTGAGTGMVLTASGQVLTNYHVVESSTSIAVTIASTGETFPATVIGHDATRDVALLQLKGASGLATVTLDDDAVAVGAQVIAVGNSKGAGQLTSAPGTVTDTATTITVSSETNASGSETLDGVIETDASAVPGDSGGPMYDDEGEVLGITTAGSQQQTRRGTSVTVASYAVPIDDAMAVVKQIRTGKSSGTVVVGGKAYLGVALATTGMTVDEVLDGTAAEKAGVVAGDVVTSLDGQRVTSRADLSEVLAAASPGDTVVLGWTTEAGRQRTASVTLTTSPVN